MQLPLQVVFRNMRHSPAIEEVVRKRVEKLEHIADNITSCRVVIDMPHHNHRKGNSYVVRIDMTVPQKEIIASTESSLDPANKDFYAVLKQAFNAAARQLEDYTRERRRNVKTHEEQPHAKVSKLFENEDYGFLSTADGREVYFHANSVLDGKFAQLEIGSAVAFAEEMGEKGPQASTVRVTKSSIGESAA